MSREIEEMARVWCPFPERHDCKGCCERCYEISKSEMLYEAGYRKQAWISVEERLPEREGKYLAYTIRGTIEMARCYSYYVNDKPQFDYWITHWMPLPEPPKGGEGR